MLPSRKIHRSKCPCGNDESFHLKLCWLFHFLFTMALTAVYFYGLLWLLSRVKSEEAICGICDCLSTRVLCPDRGFASFPDIDPEYAKTITILGLQRNNIQEISGAKLAAYHNLILLDIRDQDHGDCIRQTVSPIPENIIVRGELSCLCKTKNLVYCLE